MFIFLYGDFMLYLCYFPFKLSHYLVCSSWKVIGINLILNKVQNSLSSPADDTEPRVLIFWKGDFILCLNWVNYFVCSSEQL